MNLLTAIIGLVAGLVIGDIMNDLRVKDIQAEAEEARRESLSALEHEAYLRKENENLREENENLREANEYWKSVNGRRHLG